MKKLGLIIGLCISVSCLAKPYPEESEWTARRDLYNRILNDGTFLQDSVLAVFFETYPDSSEVFPSFKNLERLCKQNK